MFFVAFKRRKGVEELNRRRIALTAALQANSAFYKSNEGPNVRQEMIEEINERTDDVIAQIYGAPSSEEIEQAMLDSDPFFTAIDVNRVIGDKQ